MATLHAPDAANDTLYAEQVDEVVLIQTGDIDRGDRMRTIDPVWAGALGQVMSREGQRTPIEVCRLPGANRWLLVAGGHRHAGAELEGIVQLRAIVVSANRDDRRMREISENLWRRDLDPIDRAAFIAELVLMKRVQAGLVTDVDKRSASVPKRWQREVNDEADTTLATISNVYGWSTEVAEDLGFSARTVRNDLMLYRRLVPSLIERLRAGRHPVATNATQLRTLAKLDEHVQRKAVELLLVPAASLNYGQPKTVAEAIAHPLGPKPAGQKPDAGNKRLSAFLGAFQRMSLLEKKGALAQLAAQLPAGVRIVDGPEPTAGFPAQHVQYRDESLEAIDTIRELIDGLVEDKVVGGERGYDLDRANAKLRIARFTIAGNGFDMSGASA